MTEPHYDRGGFLPPGMAAAVNDSDEDEPVLDRQPDCGLPDDDRDGED
jgi:hypothetical protein